MSTQNQQNGPASTLAEGVPRIKVSLTPMFATWVYLCEDGPKHLNQRLEELAHQLMQDNSNAIQRTNHGGWHYAFDLFKVEEPVVAEFRDQMEQHVQAFLNHFRSDGNKKKDSFCLKGWITYYVKVPTDIKGGEIVFRDPRGPAVAMYETPGIELPWVGSGMGVPFSPATGHLLLFPAWLEHRVERFEGSGERISIAFNACNP